MFLDGLVLTILTFKAYLDKIRVQKLKFSTNISKSILNVFSYYQIVLLYELSQKIPLPRDTLKSTF